LCEVSGLRFDDCNVRIQIVVIIVCNYRSNIFSQFRVVIIAIVPLIPDCGVRAATSHTEIMFTLDGGWILHGFSSIKTSIHAEGSVNSEGYGVPRIGFKVMEIKDIHYRLEFFSIQPFCGRC